MGVLRTAAVNLIFLSISERCFPVLNHTESSHEVKLFASIDISSHTAGHTPSKSSKDFLKPVPRSKQPDTAFFAKEHSKTAPSAIMKSESDLPELEPDENYPTDVIEAVLKNAPLIVREFLRMRSSSFGNRVSKRNIPDQDEFTQPLCGVKKSKHRPRVTRRSVEPGDDNFYIPINLPERGDGLPQAFQEVETEICVMEGLNSATSSLGGHDNWCKQEYMDLPMVALVKNTNDLVITKIRFPHSCSCYLRP